MRKSATKQSNSKIIARHRHFAKLSLHISPLLLSTFLLWLSLNEGMCLSSFDRFDWFLHPPAHCIASLLRLSCISKVGISCSGYLLVRFMLRKFELQHISSSKISRAATVRWSIHLHCWFFLLAKLRTRVELHCLYLRLYSSRWVIGPYIQYSSRNPLGKDRTIARKSSFGIQTHNTHVQ